MTKKILLTAAVLASLLWLRSPVAAQEALETQPATPSAKELQQQRLAEEIEQLAEIYRGQLAEYRQAERQFQIDQSQYQQLQTLASIDAVVEAAQTAMRLRVQVLLTYFELLRVNLIATEGIEPNLQTAVIQRLEAQQNWLQTHQQAIATAEDRQEFNQLADTFTARLPIFTETYQEANSLLLIGTLQDVFNQLDGLSADITTTAASNSSTIDERDVRETDRVIVSLATQFDGLWSQLTTVLTQRSASGFYNNLAKNTDPVYADLNKLVSFLDELLRQL